MVSTKLITAMLLSYEVWAVYGVISSLKSPCSTCFEGFPSEAGTTNATTYPSLSVSLHSPYSPLVATHSSDPYTSSIATGSVTPATASVISTTASPPTSTAKSTEELRPGVKVGIGTAVGALGLALLIVILEACYLRKKRTQRALERAVEEVERGMDKGSEERIVLESRVSIVFDDGGDEDKDRGRNGMSLPRRD